VLIPAIMFVLLLVGDRLSIKKKKSSSDNLAAVTPVSPSLRVRIPPSSPSEPPPPPPPPPRRYSTAPPLPPPPSWPTPSRSAPSSAFRAPSWPSRS
jgi:hypothetical protein